MSFTARLAERTASALGGRVGRRDVLRRAAMAGTAMAVAPTTFALQRTSAYAAVCGCSGQNCPCGSQCCDGYTEFCCTITGRNACPPGSLLAGWWKVDGSNYCGGGARYYLDCNSGCGSCSCGSNGVCSGSCSGTPCGCARGNCNNRKAGCTRFRYGQCHSEIPCLGPIVCRVVTCTPPWQLDATCSTAVLVDNNTRFHNAACLQGQPLGALESVTAVPGGYRVRGWAADPDATGPINIHVYVNGVGTNLGPTSSPRGDIPARYPGFTWPTGFDRVVTHAGAGATANVCVYAIGVGAGGNRLLGCRSVNADARGVLERLDRVPGGVRVAGWAVDLDQPDSPTTVHVYLNGKGVNLGYTDRERPDVAALIGSSELRWGFDRVIPWTGTGSLDVCVYAINRGPGRNKRLACGTFSNPGAPVGAIDLVRREPGGVRIAGWAWDPDSPGPIQIQADIEGRRLTAGTTSQPRPDVGNRYPGAPLNCGFDLLVPWTGGTAPLRVCVRALDPQGGPARELGCRELSRASDPFGSVDHVSRAGGSLRVAGWAMDPDVSDPVSIHVYVNGTGHNLGKATVARPDVASRYPGYGPAHGFDATISVPASGPLVVDVYAIGIGAGASHRLLTRRTVP